MWLKQQTAPRDSREIAEQRRQLFERGKEEKKKKKRCKRITDLCIETESSDKKTYSNI